MKMYAFHRIYFISINYYQLLLNYYDEERYSNTRKSCKILFYKNMAMFSFRCFPPNITYLVE